MSASHSPAHRSGHPDGRIILRGGHMPVQPFANRDVSSAGPSRDYLGYGDRPPHFTWPGGKLVAVQIAVNYEEGSELSWPMGDSTNDGLGEIVRAMPEGVRDLCVESTYEYGSRVGVWRLLDLFQ